MMKYRYSFLYLLCLPIFAGTIEGNVSLTEDHSFGQVQIIVYLPGGGTLVQQWGEDPPFDINYFFEDPAITEGGPYRVEASFDLNDNNQYDAGEPYFTTGDLYLSDSNVLENVDLQLASGGASGEYSYDFEMGGPVEAFDGTGANELDGTVDFSIEFWIMFHSNPGADQILFERLEPAGAGNDMELKWSNSNQRFELNLGGPPGTQFGELTAGGMNPFDGNWHHIYIQYLGASNELEFFWDAVTANWIEPSDANPSISSSENPLRFGTDLAASVDEVRIRTTSEDYGSSFPIPTGPYLSEDVDANTIVLWHCNENGGNDLIDDGFYHNNTGWVIGSGIWDESNPWDGSTGSGYSIDFGTTGGYAETNFTALDGGTQITMEMFIKLHSSFGSGWHTLIKKDGWGALEYYGDNGEFRFFLTDIGDFPWTFSPNPSEWHHIAADYDGVNMTIYWDGSPVANLSANGNLPSNSDPMIIGENYDGLADNIRISDVALYTGNNFDPWTQDYSPTTNTFLVYYCDEGSGNQLIDHSGKNNPATITGNPTWAMDEPLGGSAGIGLWFGDYSTNYVDLEWDRWPDTDSDFQKYELRRQVNNPGVTESSPSVYVETDVNVVNWRDNDISDGNNYYYIMYAYNQSGIRYETGEQMFTPSGGASGKIECDVHVNRAISGNIYLELYYPGNDPNSGSPDEELTPQFVNLAADGHWPLQFINIPDGNGYSVVSFIDAQGSANTGSDNCDYGFDLNGMTENINITGGSIEIISVEMAECSAVADYPDISNFSITSGDAYVDNNVSISVDLNASSGISEAKLIYYLGGSYSSKPESALVEDAGVWTGIIPAGEVTMEGLMVQVYAISNNGYESTSEWIEIPVFFNSYMFSSITAEQYAMVSFPGNLETDGIKNVLEDNWGNYDPAQWRSFKYNNSNGSYDENSGSFKAGNAFWVISRESANLTGGNGAVTSLESIFTISLDQGWNMIGNPYAFNLDFPDQVATTGDVEMTLYRYNGNGYVNANEMLPGEGYWIWSNEDGAPLDFDHTVSGGSQKQMKGGWQIDLRASINGYHDSANRIGVHPLADDERDGMDAHEPPVIGNYVQLGFYNDDWKDKSIYSKDIRKECDVNYLWNVVVNSNMAGQISIDAFDTQYIPGEFDAVLVDMDNMIQHDLVAGAAYKYISIGDEQDHHFQVVIGLPENVSKILDDLGILPHEFSVDQNVPNPFNPVTSIRIQLVEDAMVTMKVFNILGEEVRTLINNEYLESGYRQIIWNSRDNANRQLPSGLYLYQTMIKNNHGKLLHMNTKKMILVK